MPPLRRSTIRKRKSTAPRKSSRKKKLSKKGKKKSKRLLRKELGEEKHEFDLQDSEVTTTDVEDQEIVAVGTTLSNQTDVQGVKEPTTKFDEKSTGNLIQRKGTYKSALKAGKERVSQNELADPWESKRYEASKYANLVAEILRRDIAPEPKSTKKKIPHKVNYTKDMFDVIDKMPEVLHQLGILDFLKRIIRNLYLMNPRPKDPCKDIHELLEICFGESDKSSAVKILEKEYHTSLLKEYRIIQEIGKLKALCHFLLPEQYGSDGRVLSTPPKDDEPEQDIIVEYGVPTDEPPVNREIEKSSVKERKREKSKKNKKQSSANLSKMSMARKKKKK